MKGGKLHSLCKHKIYSSSSSPSSSSNSTLKNLNSYTPFEVEITLSQSLKLCFLRNFFVRYFKYRPLNFAPLATTTIFPSSRVIERSSPRLPVRPSTLILSWRNFSNADGSKILSFVGADASRTYFWDCFLAAGLPDFYGVSLLFQTAKRRDWDVLFSELGPLRVLDVGDE